MLPLLKEKSPRQQYEESVRQTTQLGENPEHSALGRQRLAKTMALLSAHKLKESHIADLGCGFGFLALALAEKGSVVTAVDAATEGFSHLSHPSISVRQAFLPYLPQLADHSFDGILFTDVIAEIEPHLHRLTFSELSRLLKREGWIVCSTPLDLNSVDAPIQWLSLVETEFEVIATSKSYHRLHFYCARWLGAAERFCRASRDPRYREKQLQKRSGLMRLWFSLNSQRPLAFFWAPLSFLLRPAKKKVKKSDSFLRLSEKLSKIIWGSSALTHMIVLARKKKI